MNSSHEIKTGGASIKPSARPSIHGHRDCVFLQGERSNMVSYRPDPELNDEETCDNDSSTNKGQDEVDNIMSKFARAPSPPHQVPARVNKRNSFDLGVSYTEDSDLSSKLAKSLPISFEKSHLYSSDDEFNNWPSPSPVNISREFFQNDNLNNSMRRSDASNRMSRSPYSTPVRPDNLSLNRSGRKVTQSQTLSVVFMAIVIGVIAAMIAVYYSDFSASMYMPEVFSTSNNYNTAQFNEDLNDLRGQFKIRDDSILQIKTGISTIFKREDTGSFVFAYNGNDKNFDQDKFNNLVNTIASTAAKYLRNDSTSVQHIVVDGSKLEMRSHSELINKYRDGVTKTGVMLVREVDEVPSALAMAFHYYCDEYNPLVKKSAIFFTLDMAKCSRNPVEQNPTHAKIEKCLKEKWSGVPKDNISPLLNRVVSTVIDVAGD